MIKDELEALLVNELSLNDLAKRFNVTPTSLIKYLYDMHKDGLIVMRWKVIEGRLTRVYKLRMTEQDIDDI